jgi:hypothetical protein
MKYLALVGALAVLAAAGGLALTATTSGSTEMRGPTEVMGAFVYHIERGNFGKACGLMTAETAGPIDACSSGFVFNAGQNMTFFGIDIFAGAKLLPGSVTKADGSIVYRIKTTALPPVKVTVKQQESGRYRIVGIG